MGFLRNLGRGTQVGDRQQKILEAAKRLFLEFGYEKVGMRQIAQEAGVSPALIYRKGWTKADLLAELIFELNATQIEQLQAADLPEQGSLLEQVLTVLQRLYEFDLEHQELRKLGAAYGWLWSQEKEQRCFEQINQLMQPIQERLANAGLEPVEPRVRAIWAVYWNYFRWATIYGEDSEGYTALIKPMIEVLLLIPGVST
jgi:AcrR family transcriptional regulator